MPSCGKTRAVNDDDHKINFCCRIEKAKLPVLFTLGCGKNVSLTGDY